MNSKISLTGEQLKIIAVVTMTVDHIGAYLLPDIVFLRIIGRISFPLFAFMVGQGCIHTKNIYKYLARMTAFAVGTQIVLLPFQPFYNLNIMFTFVLSVAVAVVIKKWHNILQNATAPQKTVALISILTAVAAVYIICTAADVEYGFWGCMLAPAAFAGGYLKAAEYPNPYINQISAFAVVLVLLCFLTGVSNLTQGRDDKDLHRLEQSLRRAAVACYAAEGIYPPDLDYLVDRYGLQIDEKRYIVSYESIADNLMPDITIMERQR